ncbi:MAG TPA: primosomal protein N' [Syntrophobacteria bacterium]|nr:primosomal protein N' [Syntrophobacteria bacterium]
MDPAMIEVALPLAVPGTFHYRVPPELQDEVAVGREVVVPFGRRRLSGSIVAVGTEPPADLAPSIRNIVEITPGEPLFSEVQLPFFRWLSAYYLVPLGEVIQTAIPGGTRSVTRRVARLTEAGGRALTEAEISREERQVLALLQEHPGLGLVQIRRHLPDGDVRSICDRLRRQGVLVWEDRLRGPQAAPRRLRVVRALVQPGQEGLELKPRERELLEQLASGPRLLRDLEGQVKNTAYWVRKLGARGLVQVASEEIYRDPAGPPVIEAGPAPRLTSDQEGAVGAVSEALRHGVFSSFLLHGVTGSGKTEVYLAATAAAIDLGRQTLVLVPEIALTARLEALFRQRFQSRVAILHSSLGRGERRDEWMRIRRGEAPVVVGARSAIFAPLERLGLIVVDEEHDASYKEERGLRYHARDAAVMRAKLAGAVVLMGSATPALSSFQNALQGKFRLLRLPHRIDERPLPRVAVIDMRRQKGGTVISLPLRHALADTLAAGRQALLLINRRGYASFLLCRRCGHVPRCENCSLSLTWHRAEESLRCHLCDLAMPTPATCPRCEAPMLRPLGFGTQRVEREAQRLFPQARVSRMDRDTIQTKQSFVRLLRDLGRGAIDILVGTQMIAKGHDVPGITLVGVVNADTSLQWPDFRASEVTFQLLTQVAGRAGRGEHPGLVLVQTYNPEHYSIRYAKEHDYLGFFTEETAFLKELGYPPFRRLVGLHLAGHVEGKTREAAEKLAERFRELRERHPDWFQEVELLGPAAAPLSRIKGKYRWQLLLRARRSGLLREAAHRLVEWGTIALKGSGVQLTADVDPLSLI